MRLDDFLKDLENYYGKAFPDLGPYRFMLRKFSEEDLERIRNRLLEDQKFLPKVSQIYEAAKDLLIDTAHKSASRVDRDCDDCNGTGWEYVTSHEITTGEPYNSVRRCDCTGLPQPKPHAMGNGWISEYNGKPVPKGTGEDELGGHKNEKESSNPGVGLSKGGFGPIIPFEIPDLH
jgi:hypothetical protein